MKKLRKDTRKFIKAGVGLGIGTGVIAGAESVGGVSSGVLPAMGTAAGMMRPVAVGMMGKHTLRLTKRLMPKKRRR